MVSAFPYSTVHRLNRLRSMIEFEDARRAKDKGQMREENSSGPEEEARRE